MKQVQTTPRNNSRTAKVVRSLVSEVGGVSAPGCFVFLHQPKEPQNFAARVKAMKQDKA